VSTQDLRNELPSIDSINALLASVGVTVNSKIVLYYDHEKLLTRTARVYVTLDYAGLGDRTYVLNGGLPGWLEKERETTDQVSEFIEGDLQSLKPHEVIITASELDVIRWFPQYTLMDVRSDEEYYGEIDSTGQVISGGHIEGAYAMSYETAISENSPYMLIGDDELRAEFANAGMDPARTTILYCRSGIRASLIYLMAKHLGYAVLLYDGSMEEGEKLGLPLTTPAIDPGRND